ncbi:hypothetical protein HH310_26390 [Actinoplanes sp. TBRC 11911]|uniref:hypothetical protein n=1 Tax=Actinoplanes sp. TBRC 11911 TaxID=2729386 RepID=UPI00145F7568|nr:hypothetical protein [Actinoplanes sp. TBRC 11911]NMO54703.1 hypothetical protein [Actinoplanes sp. TBRC 11911]
MNEWRRPRETAEHEPSGTDPTAAPAMPRDNVTAPWQWQPFAAINRRMSLVLAKSAFTDALNTLFVSTPVDDLLLYYPGPGLRPFTLDISWPSDGITIWADPTTIAQLDSDPAWPIRSCHPACLTLLTAGCRWQPPEPPTSSPTDQSLFAAVSHVRHRMVGAAQPRLDVIAVLIRDGRVGDVLHRWTFTLAAIVRLFVARLVDLLLAMASQASLLEHGRAAAARPRGRVVQTPVVPRGPGSAQQLRVVAGLRELGRAPGLPSILGDHRAHLVPAGVG